jgi:hypothetical protein
MPFSHFSSAGRRENFPELVLSDWSPEHGLVRGDNRKYRFTIHNDQNALEVVADWVPVELSLEERRWWSAKAAEISARTRGVRFEIPEEKPAYRALSWDRDGRVWVERYVKGVRISDLDVPYPMGGMPVVEPVVFDVFGADGEYLWSVELPFRSRLLDSSGSRLLVATRHLQMGNKETVSVFRIVQRKK